MNMTAPTNILSDPAWFPARLDPKKGVLEFVRSSREDLVQEAFLDSRWDRAGREQACLPIDDLRGAYASLAARPHLNFLWHTAFCCSTVISRALDAPGRNLSLKEPDVLTTLADVKRATTIGGLPAYLPQGLFALLARRRRPNEAILVKPSNIANFLLPEAAQLTQGRALMLYSDCATFLVAVMDRGEERRAHVRRVFEKIVGDQMTAGRRWPVEKLFAMTDMQIAALCWHLQMSELASAMSSSWRGRAASLDCDAFLAAPSRALAAIDDFLGLGLGPEHIAGMASGPLLGSDAKGRRNAPFNLSERRDQWNALGKRLQHEIESVVAWSYEAFKAAASEPPLPLPLVSLEKIYRPS
jgi:hypothetical protein